jgi:hypothetical protein
VDARAEPLADEPKPGCNSACVDFATLATPEPIKDWSLTSLKEKLIKIGAKVISHGRYVAFQMAEVAIPRNLFADILRLIAELRPPRVLGATRKTRCPVSGSKEVRFLPPIFPQRER